MRYLPLLESTWAEHLAPRGKTAPTVVSTFAGCGGSSLGYSMAGFRELLAVEWDKHAAECLRANFHGLDVVEGDIAELSVAEVLKRTGLKPGELDVFDGSPPCQGFSTAGKRVLDDPRNRLFLEFVRLLKGLQPRVFVMENVSGLVKGKMVLVFDEIITALEKAGYRVSARLLDAQYFGVPQSRQRLIFIGVRKDLKVEPSHPEPTVRRAFTFGEAVEGITDDSGLALSPSLTAFAKKQPRRLWSSHPGTWAEYYGSVNGSMNTKWAAMDEVAGTLLKTWRKWGDGAYAGVIHPHRHRYVNAAEYRRLGAFPDPFVMPGDFFQVVARVGNCVPPLFMRAIALHIRTELLRATRSPSRKTA